MLLDGAGGVLAARLGRAGVEAVLADACEVLGAVGVAGALGLGRGIWTRQEQGAARGHAGQWVSFVGHESTINVR